MNVVHSDVRIAFPLAVAQSLCLPHDIEGTLTRMEPLVEKAGWCFSLNAVLPVILLILQEFPKVMMPTGGCSAWLSTGGT